MPVYQLVRDPSRLGEIANEIMAVPAVGLDTETTSLSPYHGKLRLVQINTGKNIWLIDLFHVKHLGPVADVLNGGRAVKVGQNCLTGDMQVLLANGSTMLLRDMVRCRHPGPVITVNEETGRLESCAVIDWVTAGTRCWEDWLKIRFKGKGDLRLTRDHQVLTMRGRVEAGELVSGDLILTPVPALTFTQRAVVYGSLLGDSSISLQKGVNARSPYVSFSHCVDQQEFAGWKYDLWGDLRGSWSKDQFPRRSGKCSFSQQVHARTRSDSRLLGVLSKTCVDSKKTITKEWLDELTLASIAIWLADDGGAKGAGISVCVQAFGEVGALLLLGYLRSFGWPAKLTCSAGVWRIQITGSLGRGVDADLASFWESIAPWFPVSMAYKIYPKYRYLAGKAWKELPPDPFLLEYAEVLEVLPLVRSGASRYDGWKKTGIGPQQYCLVVQGNSNFVAGGKFVSNCKFDQKFLLHEFGIELWPLFDTYRASAIMHGGKEGITHKLADIYEREIPGVAHKGDMGLSDWTGELSTDQLEYAAEDVEHLLLLREVLKPKLAQGGFNRVALIEFQVILPEAAMELNGFHLDADIWMRLYEENKILRDRLKEELFQELPHPKGLTSLPGMTVGWNLGSWQQKLASLHRMGVMVENTQADTLAMFAAKFPVLQKMIAYSKVSKLCTAFGPDYLKHIDSVTGRIHTSFYGFLSTARYSSSKPNLQQIPRQTRYREAFRAPDGRMIVTADYCVRRGTRVVLQRGSVPVESVHSGDLVKIEDGSLHPVEALIDKGVQPIYRVRTSMGYELEATSLHRVRVLDAAGEYVWKRIHELGPTDCLAIQANRAGTDFLPDLQSSPELTHWNSKKIAIPGTVSEDLAFFLGYLIGDGSFRPDGVRWVVNQKDPEVSSKLVEVCRCVFDRGGLTTRRYRGVIETDLFSLRLVRWLGLLGASKTSIPDFIWESPQGVVGAFLRGLFEADGCCSVRISFTSANKDLSRSVQRLMLGLGILSVRRKVRHGDQRRFTAWTLTVPYAFNHVFAQKVGFFSDRKQARLEALLEAGVHSASRGSIPNMRDRVRSLGLTGDVRTLLNNTSSSGRPVSLRVAQQLRVDFPGVYDSLEMYRTVEHETYFDFVKSVELVGEDRVYDLSVPGPVTYLSDGFVSHNSQIELRMMAQLSGDRLMLEVYRKGLDAHRQTAALVNDIALSEVTKSLRQSAKPVNFGLCVAAGQRVLTHVGLVPIERVKGWHLVWDGVDWVGHDGVVFMGHRSVITHDGLTATPDHEVYTHDGYKVPLRVAASSLCLGRLAVGGVGEASVGYTAFDRRCGETRPVSSLRRGSMFCVQQDQMDSCRQYPGREISKLHLPEREIWWGSEGEDLGSALRCHGPTLRTGDSCFFPPVQVQGYQGAVPFERAFHPLGARSLPEFDLRESEGGRSGSQRLCIRQDRQQLALLSGQPAPDDLFRELEEQGVLMPVYDLVNAGPRHRFTVEGKVVSNCFGMGAERLVEYAMSAYGVAMSLEEAEDFRERYFKGYSGVRAWHRKTLKEGKRTGISRTMSGRIRYLEETAYSEHLNCVDSETEALTRRGWVKGFDLTLDDVILTKNADTGVLEWQHMTDLRLWPDIEGQFVEFRSRSFSAVTTLDHRWLVFNKAASKDECRTSQELSVHGDHRIHRTGEYLGTCVYSDDFVTLVGWFLTDGGFRYTKRKTMHDRPQAILYQSDRANMPKVLRIEALVDRLGLSCWRSRDKVSCECFWYLPEIISAQLHTLLPERVLTFDFLTKISKDQALILMSTMIDGDGCRSDRESFCSGSLCQAQAFQALAVLCGYASTLHERDMSKYKPKSSKLLTVSKMGTVWYVTVLRRDKVQIQKRHKRVFVGRISVWCPVVPNTFFVARRSGHVYITGNTPVQGACADGLKASLPLVYQKLKKYGGRAKLVHMVHDEIEIESGDDPEELEAVKQDLVDGMTEGMQQFLPDVAVVVDAAFGKSWAEH